MADEDLLPTGGEEDVVDTPQIEEEQSPTVETQEPSIEDLAADMGWTPKDQWRGDPDKWKPATEFVRNTVDVNHKLSTKLKGIEDQLSHMSRTTASIAERAAAEARQKLLEERQEAFDTGDAKRFEEVDRQLAQMAPAPAPMAPEAKAFIDRNASWWNKDIEATNWATNRTNELAAMGLSNARQLAIVEREMKEFFPELVAERPRAKEAPLNTPGARAAAPARKSFASLPDEAKRAALDCERRKVCTKEEYAKIYFEEQEA